MITTYEDIENKISLLEQASNKSNMKTEYACLIYRLKEKLLNMTVEQTEVMV